MKRIRQPGPLSYITHPRKIGFLITGKTGDIAEVIFEKDAEYIKATWNACEEAGLSTKALESGALKDLLEALKAIMAWHHKPLSEDVSIKEKVRSFILAEKALAKAEEV